MGGGLLEPGGREGSTDEVMKTVMSQPDESDVFNTGNHRKRVLQGPPSGARLICVLFSATSGRALTGGERSYPGSREVSKRYVANTLHCTATMGCLTGGRRFRGIRAERGTNLGIHLGRTDGRSKLIRKRFKCLGKRV